MVLKITGARNQPFSDIRKRALMQAGAKVVGRGPTRPDETAFLGLSEADLTPAVQGAIRTLLTEVDDLRQEVSRLKARLNQAEILADQDPLTPALNRRALMRELERIRTFSHRYGSPAALVYIDLDDFKSVNDRFGHAAGDEALRAVADRLRSQMSGPDLVARIGGDEFAVVFGQATLAGAEARARNLARSLESTPIRFGEWSAPIHVSFGVSEITPDLAPEEVVARADAAMYARRRERRS
ncbi:MAG: GGDEF domain-containing protein [Phenylobacterium sp.]|jgi:diguanylate cyclase (GGDEF)-like protein|uniref:GGDEF domain-containing protein n=1 Tax=Phenylobacterium sp. TaxID=1871053 RepID=UPI003016A1F8